MNAIYGVLQLLVARRPAGTSTRSVLSPITGGASQINVYGAVEGASVFRPNALTGDPNHLGIMLIVPLLVLTPLYLRLERRHRLQAAARRPDRVPARRRALDALAQRPARPRRRRDLLALPYRRYLQLARAARPARRRGRRARRRRRDPASFLHVVLRSRVQTGGGSESAHFQVYSFVPQILHSHPLFGLGLNNFSIYYEFVTGKSNWGPHSFYVSLIVETGLVGTALFAVS